MTHWEPVNSVMLKMENAKFTFRRAGRRIRRWHKFVTGLIDGVLVTVCVCAAKMRDVIESFGLDVVRRIEHQTMLSDAWLRGAC